MVFVTARLLEFKLMRYNFIPQYSLSRLDVVGDWERFVTLPGMESLFLCPPLLTPQSLHDPVTVNLQKY